MPMGSNTTRTGQIQKTSLMGVTLSRCAGVPLLKPFQRNRFDAQGEEDSLQSAPVSAESPYTFLDERLCQHILATAGTGNTVTDVLKQGWSSQGNKT